MPPVASATVTSWPASAAARAVADPDHAGADHQNLHCAAALDVSPKTIGYDYIRGAAVGGLKKKIPWRAMSSEFARKPTSRRRRCGAFEVGDLPACGVQYRRQVLRHRRRMHPCRGEPCRRHARRRRDRVLPCIRAPSTCSTGAGAGAALRRWRCAPTKCCCKRATFISIATATPPASRPELIDEVPRSRARIH